MVADHQKDWDVRLPFALAAYRATRHSSTGYTPNFLVFGREVRSPADVVYGVDRGTNIPEYDSFIDDIWERMTAAYDQVREHIRQNAQYNKRYYDVKVQPKDFKPGQWVWYLNLRKALRKQQKWISQYKGPYLIIRMLSPLVAEIQRNSRTAPKVVHIDKHKPHLGPTPRTWLSPGSNSDTRQTPVPDRVPETPLHTTRDSTRPPRRQLRDVSPSKRPGATSSTPEGLTEEAESGIGTPTQVATQNSAPPSPNIASPAEYRRPI